MVNNLADDGDVLVKRKKFVGGRSVGRSTVSGWVVLVNPVPCCCGE